MVQQISKRRYLPACARNTSTYINMHMHMRMCMPASARSVCVSVRNMCKKYLSVPVSTECFTGCYGCTCVVVPNNYGHSGSFILEDCDKQKTSNTLTFIILSSFVLLVVQLSKSKYRHSF